MTEWRLLWDVNPEERFTVKSASAVRTPAIRDMKDCCCDFVGGLVNATCEGRYCLADNTFCPQRIFEDSKIWETCPTRLEKLKIKKEQT